MTTEPLSPASEIFSFIVEETAIDEAQHGTVNAGTRPDTTPEPKRVKATLTLKQWDGKPANWKVFLRRVEDIISMENIQDDRQKCAILRSGLPDNKMQQLEDLDEENYNNFEKTVELLEKRNGRSKETRMAEAIEELVSLRQTGNEDGVEYLARAESVLRQWTMHKNIIEKIPTYFFINGINNNQTREIIAAAVPDLQWKTAAETFARISVTTKNPALPLLITHSIDRQPSTRNPLKRPRNCRWCNKEGHEYKDCAQAPT